MAADALVFFAARVPYADCKLSLAEKWVGEGKAKVDDAWQQLYILPHPEVNVHMWSDHGFQDGRGFPQVPEAPTLGKLRAKAKRITDTEPVFGFFLNVYR